MRRSPSGLTPASARPRAYHHANSRSQSYRRERWQVCRDRASAAGNPSSWPPPAGGPESAPPRGRSVRRLEAGPTWPTPAGSVRTVRQDVWSGTGRLRTLAVRFHRCLRMSSFDGGSREFEESDRLTRRKRDARYDKRNGTVMATGDGGRALITRADECGKCDARLITGRRATCGREASVLTSVPRAAPISACLAVVP